MRTWDYAEEQDGVRLLQASECEPRASEWLWHHWLPAKAITILAGAPGAGKTTVALQFASIVSNGDIWPDDSQSGSGQNVVIWSGEDCIATTLILRLIAARANLSRVHFVTSTQEQGRLREFDPARDIRQLTLKISEIGGAALVIVDPLISTVSGDAHRANDVRRDLSDLVVLGRSGPAVVGISHFSKGTRGSNTLDRLIGSQAFGALARVVLVAAKRQGQDERVLLRAKNNIGPDGNGFVYNVEPHVVSQGIETSLIRWGEALEGDVDLLMRDVEQNEVNPSRLDEAKHFITGLFEDTERLAAKAVYEQARAAGHSPSTINRAKSEMPIRTEKQGNGGWFWCLSGRPTSSR